MSAFRVFLALPILTVRTMVRDDLCTSHLGHCLAKGGVERVVVLSIAGTCRGVGGGGGRGLCAHLHHYTCCVAWLHSQLFSRSSTSLIDAFYEEDLPRITGNCYEVL